jgi:hypothetical protein
MVKRTKAYLQKLTEIRNVRRRIRWYQEKSDKSKVRALRAEVAALSKNVVVPTRKSRWEACVNFDSIPALAFAAHVW